MTTKVALLALVILFIAVALWKLGTKRKAEGKAPISSGASFPPGLADRNVPVPPVPFGYKTGWFAVRSTDVKALAQALQLQDLQPANWQYGIWHSVESDDYAVFVSPPVNGWMLAVGTPILFEADEHATQRMIELSRQFGEVQFFASMRTSEAYAWARAKDGRLIRRFYEGDGTRSEAGPLTEEERELGQKFFDAASPEAKDPGYWKRKDLSRLDEDYVLKIAGKWSVDPTKLNELGLAPALGIVGKPSGSYPPSPRRTRRH